MFIWITLLIFPIRICQKYNSVMQIILNLIKNINPAKNFCSIGQKFIRTRVPLYILYSRTGRLEKWKIRISPSIKLCCTCFTSQRVATGAIMSHLYSKIAPGKRNQESVGFPQSSNHFMNGTRKSIFSHWTYKLRLIAKHSHGWLPNLNLQVTSSTQYSSLCRRDS